MVKVIATKDFAGSVINREDLGGVREGETVEVSENDAQYLERDGLVERVIDEPAESAAASTPPADPPASTAPPEI